MLYTSNTSITHDRLLQNAWSPMQLIQYTLKKACSMGFTPGLPPTRKLLFLSFFNSCSWWALRDSIAGHGRAGSCCLRGCIYIRRLGFDRTHRLSGIWGIWPLLGLVCTISLCCRFRCLLLLLDTLLLLDVFRSLMDQSVCISTHGIREDLPLAMPREDGMSRRTQRPQTG